MFKRLWCGITGHYFARSWAVEDFIYCRCGKCGIISKTCAPRDIASIFIK